MICDRCVTIPTLKKFVVDVGHFALCSYCGESGSTCQDETLISYLQERFEESYSPVDTLSSYDYYMCMESGADDPRAVEYWEPLSDTYELAHPEFIEKLVEALAPVFGGENFYLNDGSLQNNSFEISWADFEWGVHHRQRFFNSEARDFLNSLFDFFCVGGHLMPEVILRISSSENLYRARKADGHKKIEAIEANPVAELGPTPISFASSQRMTPRGISAMYCARDRQTCLSELRPLAGDVMVSGAFTPTTHMDFLDLTKVESISEPNLHPFDPNYSKANNAYHFLKKLVSKMSKPNTKKDDLAYLATQVVFEYLRHRFANQVAGLAFPSVQTGLAGQNVVIFPESCVLEAGAAANNHGQPATLKFVDLSIVVHAITAVTTTSEDFHGDLDYRIGFNL